MIKWKAIFSGWVEVTPEQAKRLVNNFYDKATGIAQEQKETYINDNLLQGSTVAEVLKCQ